MIRRLLAPLLLLAYFALLATPAFAQNVINFSTDIAQADGVATPTLTWSTSPAASSCVASGQWSGEKGAAGSETLPAITESATYNLDRKAGLLQVTDFPERFDRVSLYLDTVHEHVHRQVQIDARVIEVELADPDAQSLDWAALAESVGAGRPSGVQ